VSVSVGEEDGETRVEGEPPSGTCRQAARLALNRVEVRRVKIVRIKNDLGDIK
jgi:hypothetical protein